MAKEYPDIKADYNHVDACCMWMVKNPEYYDVIVTTNMFGDIITDLGGIIQGGLGVAAGGKHQPGQGRGEHVRADGRQRPQVHRPERNQPHRGHQRGGDAAGAHRPAEGCRAGLQGHSVVTGTKMKSQAAGKMG